MHERLSVHTVGFGPMPARDFIEDLAEARITRVGMQVTQVEAGGVSANLAAARAAGIEILDLVASDAAFTFADESRWPSERDRFRVCVDVAVEAGASILYMTSGPARALTWDEAAARFTEAIAPIVEYAGTAGVSLAVENTNTMRADLGFVHGVRDVMDLASMAGIAPCADLCAGWTDRGLESALREGASQFAMVQVSDFVLGTMCSADRAVPGDGDIPIQRHLSWLAEAGYTGPIEMELLGPRITAEGPAAAGARAVSVMTELVEEAFAG